MVWTCPKVSCLLRQISLSYSTHSCKVYCRPWAKSWDLYSLHGFSISANTTLKSCAGFPAQEFNNGKYVASTKILHLSTCLSGKTQGCKFWYPKYTRKKNSLGTICCQYQSCSTHLELHFSYQNKTKFLFLKSFSPCFTAISNPSPPLLMGLEA